MRHEAIVRRTCRRFAGSADDEDDLCQMVWLHVLKRIRIGQRPATSSAVWTRTVARRACLDHVRKEARRRELADPALAADREPSVDPVPCRAFLSRRVRTAVAGLPRRQREVVELRYLRGMTTREVADSLAVAEGTVKASLHAALGNLQSSADPCWLD